MNWRRWNLPPVTTICRSKTVRWVSVDSSFRVVYSMHSYVQLKIPPGLMSKKRLSDVYPWSLKRKLLNCTPGDTSAKQITRCIARGEYVRPIPFYFYAAKTNRQFCCECFPILWTCHERFWSQYLFSSWFPKTQYCSWHSGNYLQDRRVLKGESQSRYVSKYLFAGLEDLKAYSKYRLRTTPYCYTFLW